MHMFRYAKLVIKTEAWNLFKNGKFLNEVIQLNIVE